MEIIYGLTDPKIKLLKTILIQVPFRGHNEVLNTDTEKVQDKIRNAIVGTGALARISELQWGRLIKYF